MDVSLFLAAVGTAVAIVSILVAYVFYRKGQRVRKPSWDIRSENLITDYAKRLPGIEVVYLGQQVGNLTVSKVMFWNDGRETVRHEDVAEADPIRVVSKAPAAILSAEVLQVNSEPNSFSVSLEPAVKAAYLHFEYIDHGEGAVIQVIHSGRSSEDVDVIGTVKGAGKPARKHIKVIRYLPLPTSRAFDQRLKPHIKRRLFIFLAAASFTLLLVSIGGFAAVAYTSTAEWLTALFAVLFGGSLAVFQSTIVRLGPAVPPGLESFETET